MNKYQRIPCKAGMIGLLFLFASGCGSSRYIAVPDLDLAQSVKLYHEDGTTTEGIIIRREGPEVTFVNEADHNSTVYRLDKIRRAELSTKTFDLDANPISDAEIAKYKGQRNFWGYAIGGAAIGGLSGIAVGIPIWLAADNPPPLFVGGLGAVLGSIFFAGKGIRKDEAMAVRIVRENRIQEQQMQAQKDAETEQLNQLNAEKERLMQELKEKNADPEND